jgi:hypothetical protein
MSSDYRPRSGSEGGSRSGGGSSGGRRRRGGRGRSSHGGTGTHSENRVHTNGTSSTAPKKQESTLSKLIGWLTGKKSKPEPKHTPRTTTSRPEFKEREPRADRPERTERPRREDRPPKAEPVPQEITSPKLYVGNLAYEAAESDLFDLFSKVGAVKNVEIAMDRHSSRSKGFGFVEMETLETAKEAATKLNRTDFMGRQIVVSGAKVDKRPTQSSPRDEDPTSHEHDATSSSNPDATA